MPFITGVLVSLHRKPQNRSKSVEAPSIDLGDARCGHGDLNKDALQQVIAAKWAVDVINAQSGSQDLKIGKSIQFSSSNSAQLEFIQDSNSSSHI